MSAFVDFNNVKNKFTIEDVMKKLGLNFTLKNNQYRGACPRCEGHERALVITPAKGLWYCFDAKQGGDQIQLTAHLKDVSAKEAAQWIIGKDSSSHNSQGGNGRAEGPDSKGLTALPYLEADHPAVVALGFDAAIAEALGVGFAPRGTMSGRVLIPLRTPTGTLAGYAGIDFADDAPLRLPAKFFL